MVSFEGERTDLMYCGVGALAKLLMGRSRMKEDGCISYWGDRGSLVFLFLLLLKFWKKEEAPSPFERNYDSPRVS
jgi:hypothetical protein